MKKSVREMYRENLEALHLCDYVMTALQYLEDVGEATAEEIHAKCGIDHYRMPMVLACLQQTGFVVSRGRKIKRFALRHRDPELSYLWQKEDKAR